MDELPFQKVKTRRRRSHCPPGVIACEDEFDCKELESLFHNYNLKLEQASTLKALCVLLLLSSGLSLLELLLSGAGLSVAKCSYPVHCVVFIALFIVSNVKYLQVPQLQQIAHLSLFFSLTFALLCCPFPHASGAAGPEQGVWPLLLLTFVAYALLPVRTLLALLFGLLVSVSHTVVAAASVTVKTQRLWRAVSLCFFTHTRARNVVLHEFSTGQRARARSDTDTGRALSMLYAIMQGHIHKLTDQQAFLKLILPI